MDLRNSPSLAFPFAVTLLLVLWSVPAFAESEADRRRMLELSDQATEAVLDGRYEEGAFLFREAYETYPDPVLLKNEMVAWFRADNCLGALPAGATYLDLDSPDVTESDRQDVHLVQFRCLTRMTEEALQDGHFEEAELLLGDLGALALSAEEKEHYVALQERLEAQRPPAPAPEPQPVAKVPVFDKDVIGWGLTGTGSAIVVTTLVYHVKILGEQRELREATTMEGFLALQERYDRPHNRARVLVPTLYTLGAATIGAGVYFLMQDGDGDRASSSTLSLTPAIGPGYTGAALLKRF